MNLDYYKTWEEYLTEHPDVDEKQSKAMAPKMQTYEEMLFGFIMYLCV